MEKYYKINFENNENQTNIKLISKHGKNTRTLILNMK